MFCFVFPSVKIQAIFVERYSMPFYMNHGYLFLQNAPTLRQQTFYYSTKETATEYSMRSGISHKSHVFRNKKLSSYNFVWKSSTQHELNKITYTPSMHLSLVLAETFRAFHEARRHFRFRRLSYSHSPTTFYLIKRNWQLVDTYFLQQVSFSRQRALFVFVNDSLFIRNIIFLFLDHFSQYFRQHNVIDLKIQVNRKYNQRKLESSILPHLAVV